MNKGIIFTHPVETIVGLNVDKIKTLDDVKRVLDFMDITVTLKEGVVVKGFDNVKDLFGN